MATLFIEDVVAEALETQAKAQGLSVDAYLRAIAQPTLQAKPTLPSYEAAREFDTVLDELFKTDPRPLPSSPLTYSRQDIYSDHD